MLDAVVHRRICQLSKFSQLVDVSLKSLTVKILGDSKKKKKKCTEICLKKGHEE